MYLKNIMMKLSSHHIQNPLSFSSFAFWEAETSLTKHCGFLGLASFSLLITVSRMNKHLFRLVPSCCFSSSCCFEGLETDFSCDTKASVQHSVHYKVLLLVFTSLHSVAAVSTLAPLHPFTPLPICSPLVAAGSAPWMTELSELLALSSGMRSLGVWAAAHLLLLQRGWLQTPPWRPAPISASEPEFKKHIRLPSHTHTSSQAASASCTVTFSLYRAFIHWAEWSNYTCLLTGGRMMKRNK